MRRVRFAGFAHTRQYRGGDGQPWEPGEVREVPVEEAARLVSSFGGAFEIVPDPIVAPAVAPPVTKAAKGQRKRG